MFSLKKGPFLFSEIFPLVLRGKGYNKDQLCGSFISRIFT